MLPGGHEWGYYSGTSQPMSSYYHSFEDGVTVDEIYDNPIFNSLSPSDAYMRQ